MYPLCFCSFSVKCFASEDQPESSNHLIKGETNCTALV